MCQSATKAGKNAGPQEPHIEHREHSIRDVVRLVGDPVRDVARGHPSSALEEREVALEEPLEGALPQPPRRPQRRLPEQRLLRVCRGGARGRERREGEPAPDRHVSRGASARAAGGERARQAPRGGHRAGEAVHGGGGARPALRDGLPLGGDVGEDLGERARRRRRGVSNGGGVETEGARRRRCRDQSQRPRVGHATAAPRPREVRV